MCCQHQAVNWRTIETINGPSLNISKLILDGIGLCSRCANATQTLIQQNALNSVRLFPVVLIHSDLTQGDTI